MGPLHTQVFGPDGSWKASDWFPQPAGIQRLTVNGRTDIWPSWYSKTKSNPTEQITFDKVSKKKATDCTPANAKETLEVQKFTDVITKKTCTFRQAATMPTATMTSTNAMTPSLCRRYQPDQKTITVSVSQGSHQTVTISVNGQQVSLDGHGAGDYQFDNPANAATGFSVTATVTDTALYADTQSKPFRNDLRV